MAQNDDNTFETELTAQQVRDLIDGIPELDCYDDLILQLDEVQGPVFSGKAQEMYLLIKVAP